SLRPVCALSFQPPSGHLESEWKLAESSRRVLSFLDCVRGLADHIDYQGRLGQHRDMTAVCFDGCGAHMLGDEPLQLGMNSAILGGNDVPARLRLPSGSIDLLVKQVRR